MLRKENGSGGSPHSQARWPRPLRVSEAQTRAGRATPNPTYGSIVEYWRTRLSSVWATQHPIQRTRSTLERPKTSSSPPTTTTSTSSSPADIPPNFEENSSAVSATPEYPPSEPVGQLSTTCSTHNFSGVAPSHPKLRSSKPASNSPNKPPQTHTPTRPIHRAESPYPGVIEPEQSHRVVPLT